MKFYFTLSFIGCLLLIASASAIRPSERAQTGQLGPFFIERHGPFKESFSSPQNANVLWGLMTGIKKGITPRTLADFKSLELAFLFSPSGLHLGSLLLIFYWAIKKIRSKKIRRNLKAALLCLCYFLPFYTIKRIVLFRLLFMVSGTIKKRPRTETLFIITFALSFILGHYSASPLGFTYSFLFMGVFIALRDQSRPFLIMGLFAIHVLIALFMNQEVSYLSLWINVPLLAIFSLLMPLGYLYFLSFQFLPFNWIEPLVRGYIVLIHWGAGLTKGLLINSSVFLLLAVWMIMLRKNKWTIAVLLFLHANCVQGPAIFSAHHYT